EGRRRGGLLSLRLVGERFYEAPPTIPVRIATFLPSLDRLSILLAKVTEVGADEIFLIVDRQDRRGGEPAGSLERWRRTVTEAASQSKRAYVPTIHEPMPFEAFLDAHRKDAFLCDPAGQVVVGEVRSAGEVRSIAVIGPEAGLSPVEIGLPTARLPGNILRIETAAIIAAALLVVGRERIVVSGRK
ncbi:MAG: RsmE family RNA methyltransferase, partial [Acidimicrobiales bacterium]